MTHRLLLCASSLEGGGSERQLWQLACGMHRRQWPTEVYLLYRRGIHLSKLPEDMRVHAWDIGSRSNSLPSDIISSPDTRNLPQGLLRSRAGGAGSDRRPSSLSRMITGWLPGSIHRDQVRHLAQVVRDRRIGVVYDRGYHCTLITSVACRQANAARVSVIVSPPSRDFGQARERFKSTKYRRLKQAYSDPRAVVLAVSQSTADDAIDYYRLPQGSIIVVPSPVDIGALQLAAEASSQGIAQSSPTFTNENTLSGNAEFRVVVAARMTAEKGHKFLLKSAAVWRQRFQGQSKQSLAIDLLGDGPLMSELKEMVQYLSLEDCTCFHGYQENVYPWIARADAVCIPSQYEGLSNVALEAMALGTPVIASAGSRLQSLLGTNNERGIVLDADNTESLAKAIQDLMEQPDLASEITSAAQRWIRENHSLEGWLEQMAKIFGRCG